jgi:hypothetical protein
MADGLIEIIVGADPGLQAWLEDRTDRMLAGSSVLHARVELGMWRGVLASELGRICLTLDQANCLGNVAKSSNTPLDAGLAASAPLMFINTAETFQLADEVAGQSSYGKRWGINEEELLAYLRELGPTADHALRDAISRWLEMKAEPTAEGWAAVGLVVAESSRNGEAE